MSDTLLEVRGLSKSFPGVRALGGVDFTVRRGEIHALMGENGAGKSTLIKVLTGVYERDVGATRLDGKAIFPRSPREAEACGISTVYQEVNLIPDLSVAENRLDPRIQDNERARSQLLIMTAFLNRWEQANMADLIAHLETVHFGEKNA